MPFLWLLVKREAGTSYPLSCGESVVYLCLLWEQETVKEQSVTGREGRRQEGREDTGKGQGEGKAR